MMQDDYDYWYIFNQSRYILYLHFFRTCGESREGDNNKVMCLVNAMIE